MPVSSSSSASGIAASSALSFAIRARSLSRWLLTETYSPSAIDTAPPTRPAAPAVSTGPRAGVAPATPTAMAATETIPSFAPSTPARRPFSRLANPPAWGSWACCIAALSAVGVGLVGSASVTPAVKQEPPARATKAWLSSVAAARGGVHAQAEPARQLLLRLHPQRRPRGPAGLVEAVTRPGRPGREGEEVAGGEPGEASASARLERIPDEGPALVPLHVDAERAVGALHRQRVAGEVVQVGHPGLRHVRAGDAGQVDHRARSVAPRPRHHIVVAGADAVPGVGVDGAGRGADRGARSDQVTAEGELGPPHRLHGLGALVAD